MNFIGTDTGSPSSRSRTSAVHIAINGLVFLAALIACCLAIASVTPLPESLGHYAKYVHFRQHAARYDTIFVGSSRFYHQLIPQQFDAEIASRGGETTSFNLANDALWPPESFYWLRSILALRPPHLKWVIIELMDINTNLEDRTSATERTSYWHDWQHTRIALREIAESPRTSEQKWSLGIQHAQLGVQQMTGIGRGAELLRRRTAPPKKSKPSVWHHAEGWLPEPDQQMTGKQLDEYLWTVGTLKNGIPPSPITPVYRDALADIIGEIRQLGAEPIFVITPTINPLENFTGVPAGATVLAFNDPQKYPTLFEPDRHFDKWHLNAKGAAEFTAALATECARVMGKPR